MRVAGCGIPPPLKIEIRECSDHGGYFSPLSIRACKFSDAVGAEHYHRYMIPFKKTQESIDAVLLTKDTTVLFQITVSPTHRLNLHEIIGIRNQLPANAQRTYALCSWYPIVIRT
jgi:hypothetical protein